ncbi:fumarylacetoacetate hydrolase family protein [Streptomyces yaanensis]|uniref:Fumarylacetoacetate hydrolase family protein n=1 Tax=Streptomyces yaanensis TaxID=1142239 RepID=A0ABV7SM02_9ACTN|nr:fumarylacetoacetate hydrolase family protein [Streptomyces sp. CGMCC 4.7035]WNC00383.1 fumarylacetoacetate hydrolase family protein [Streptomyces sp. CGMCC 4.7035]
MRIACFDDDRIGLVRDGRVLDITDRLTARLAPGPGSLARRMVAHFAHIRPLLEELAAGAGPSAGLPLDEVRLRSPIPDPTKIVAAPVNYRDHQTEMSKAFHISALGFCLKSPSSLLDPGGTVRLPYCDRRFDHEAEFALVVGRRATHVTPEEALDHVFGYTGLMDITMRGGEDRSTRKSFDTFTPMGPWLVTPDELGSPDDVGLELTVNGAPRQKANTRDLIWSAAHFLAYVSTVTVLKPGDVITTGTPAGVAPIQDGDAVELIVDRVGRLTVGVTAESAVPCPTGGAGRGPVPPAAPRTGLSEL